MLRKWECFTTVRPHMSVDCPTKRTALVSVYLNSGSFAEPYNSTLSYSVADDSLTFRVGPAPPVDDDYGGIKFGYISKGKL